MVTGSLPLVVALVAMDRGAVAPGPASAIQLGRATPGRPGAGPAPGGITVRELDMLQIATHPLLTSAPTVHPLISASYQALAKLRADHA